MLLNYWKIAFRNLLKHKLFSFINIFGLASGMTICMLAMIKIKDAYDYDTFHPNSKQTYRIITHLNRKNGEHFLCASSPLLLSSYLKNNYTAIDKSTSVFFSIDEVFANNKMLRVKEAFVDADFYTIFGFSLSSGTPANSPNTVVLTSETAERFFGKTNAIGQVITIGKSNNLVVTGILEKPPFSSHLKFDFLASTSSLPSLQKVSKSNDWTNEAEAYTYIQLKSGLTAKSLNPVLSNLSKQVNDFLPTVAAKSFVFDFQQLDHISPGTKPMYNTTDEPIFPYLVAFSLIGLSMLLLAFFNYINLTLARSLDRAREVGIRKVAGASKKNLMFQFLSESVLIAMLAFGLAHLQLKLISQLPVVRAIIGNVVQDTKLWIYFIVFTILTGLLSGWIPAKVFSAFKPIRVLKGRFNTKLLGRVGLRKSLTVIQFATSLIAIISLSVFYKQSIYMATANYGFNQQGILNIQLPKHTYEKSAAAFLSVHGVEGVSGTSALWGFSGADAIYIKPNKRSDSLPAALFSISPSLINNMGIKLIAGENLPDKELRKDLPSVVINEEACRMLQFKDPVKAIGQIVWTNDSTQYKVAGVVEDFHYASFKSTIKPLLLLNRPDDFRILTLKISKAAEQNILIRLQQQWKQLYPNQPFEASWFDKQLYNQHLHKDDLLFIGLLTIMALSIACLGLLGTVIYTTQNRSKEVGIRRVMGAKLSQVIITLSWDFIKLLLLSVCIGLPLGLIAGQQFLQQYAYRITVNFGILAGSAAALLIIGSITIGWQTYFTALTNPVRNLRTE